MFGYVSINEKTLTREQRDRYQAVYCGLCRALGAQYGAIGRMTLTYDMTFLVLLLSSVYALPEDKGKQRCPVALPLRSCAYATCEATPYAADMSILLAYYKGLDDWTDEHSLSGFGKSKALKKRASEAAVRWPRQSDAIKKSLEDLLAMEKRNELNPDIPTNCFGALMGALFAWRADEKADILRSLGTALGRFIYMMDACVDLRSDIRHQRYNPLVSVSGRDHTPLLTMLIGECTTIFETLSLLQDVRILQNILYSGVWTKYRALNQEGQG